jgi:metal-dependent amidase/aminoacylase/carboxypeptidase family protein
MATLGETIMLKNDDSYTASTDMGNVSFEVPSFHGAFPIPTEPDVSMHHPKFAAHASTDEAHQAAIRCAKGMALLAVRAVLDPHLAEEARKDFEVLEE